MELMKNSLVKIAVIGIAGIALISTMTVYLAMNLQKSTRALEMKERQIEEIRQEKVALQENYDKIHKDYIDIHGQHSALEEEILRLQRDLDTLARDRDNLLIQVKKKIADKDQMLQLQRTLEEMEEKLAARQQEKEEALGEIAALQEQVEELLKRKQESTAAYQQVVDEKEQILCALASLRQETGVQEIEEEKTRIARQKEELQLKLDELSPKIADFQNKEEGLRAEVASLSAQLAEAKNDYLEVAEQNRAFEKKFYEAPSKFAELSRENKVLKERTANMHYNLGVFYLKRKEHARALKEFRQALELRPEDPYVHFNIGYIYAEYIMDRQKAVEHFEKYLKYVGRQEDELDWVRKYITTWKSWSAAETMK